MNVVLPLPSEKVSSNSEKMKYAIFVLIQLSVYLSTMDCTTQTQNSDKLRQSSPTLGFCNYNGKIDAIAEHSKKLIYIFYGDQYAIHRKGKKNITLEEGNISDLWPEVGSNIDAAFTNVSSDTIQFFKGSMVWKYKHTILFPGYPRNIREIYEDAPQVVSAAAYCHVLKTLYLFSKYKYYMYMDGSKKASTIRGVPNFQNTRLPIDAVFFDSAAPANRQWFLCRGEYCATHRISEDKYHTFFNNMVFKAKVIFRCQRYIKEGNTDVPTISRVVTDKCKSRLGEIFQDIRNDSKTLSVM